MDDHIDEFHDNKIPEVRSKQHPLLSQSGLVMSILGFVGVAGLLTDLIFEWIQIDRYVDPLKFLGGSVTLLVFGSIFSKLFGSTNNQRTTNATHDRYSRAPR